jgi:choline transport protein
MEDLKTFPLDGEKGVESKVTADTPIYDDTNATYTGYVEELPRSFGVLSVFGIGYSICSAPTAMILSFGLIVGSGGQSVFIWGQILIYFVAICVAVSLAELASAFPNAGGQYYWAARLAPKSWHRSTSYIIGNISWASTICGCASVLISVADMAVSMYTLSNPDAQTHPWNIFITYQIINLLMFVLNCWESILPRLSRFWLTIALATALIIFITILARAPVKQPASYVFAGFTNYTGWNNGLAFLTGLLGVNWGFSCLDAVTHMAEEIPDPRRNIPKALIGTVVVNAVLAWPMAIALMFCLQNAEGVFDAVTGLSSLDFFLQIFEGETAGPLALQSLMFVAALGAIFGTQTWQSRLAWTIARDNGLPLSKYISRVAPAPFNVPFWAHVYSTFFVALLGCLYLGSDVAFNSFVSGTILLQYVSYSFCILCLLKRGRSSITHGPFWMGNFGLFCNIVTVVWTVFSLVFFCFPPYYPVTLTTMNYVSIVVVGFIVLAIVSYVAFGRRTFSPLPRE